jgi:hypothetical protein
MPVIKLTKRSVDALVPREKTYLARDTDLKGFVCRVTPAGAKSWCIAYRPNRAAEAFRKKYGRLEASHS